jgi:hypothetical protein
MRTLRSGAGWGLNDWMAWIRSNRRPAAWVALFAVALQFCLSFGHIHPDDIYGPVGESLTVAEAVVLPSAESIRSIAADQPWYDDDALCPICETMYFLNTAFTPAVPQGLPLPFVTRPVEHTATIGAFFIAPRHAIFQSRAPPIA